MSRCILEHVPKEAEITRIEFEGPALAIYTKKPEILFEQSYIVGDIVKLIRKRIVVRSDPSVRLPEKSAERIVSKVVPQEAGITSMSFDPSLGEVVIEAEKPGFVIGRNGTVLREIMRQTRWRPRVLRSPPIPSKITAHIRHFLHAESKERDRVLRTIGERIFRPMVYGTGDVRVTALGGFQEVGRSAILVQTKESQVLLDCGINPGSKSSSNAYPRLDAEQFDPDTLDAVVVSHSHLDHCGFLPFLFKYGYDGPVYCSAPTLSLMTLLQLDYLDVLSRQGVTPPYDQRDVRESVLHTIPLRYGAVTDVAPDVRLTLHNAGHILGSSIIHLHVGEGLHNIVYTGDYKYGRTMLLEPADTEFPRVETVITESTYGGPRDLMPPRIEAEERLASSINATLDRGGKVLIPVPAVGRELKQGVVGVFAASAFNPRETVQLKDGTTISLAQYTARRDLQLLRASDFNQKLREKGCLKMVSVQKVCKRAGDEEEVRETLDRIWKQPEKGEEVLNDLLEKNRDIYQFEKMLEETKEKPD